MSDRDTFDEPPDENEAYEPLDEALDEEDALSPGRGPEGERDLDSDLVVDERELEDSGAALDDPDRISLLDGGIDDPDGSGSPPPTDREAGWDVDPEERPEARDWDEGTDEGAEGDAVGSSSLADVPELAEPDEIPSGTDEMDEVPDDR